MNSQVSNEILSWVLSLVSTIITAVLLPLLVDWLKTKVKSKNLEYVITELSHTVGTSINYVNQTFVEQLKTDNKFDKEKQKEALTLAFKQVWSNLTAKTKDILSKEGIDAQALIIQYIEAAIAESKNK